MVIRPYRESDRSWAESLLGEFGGPLQARRGQLIDVLAAPCREMGDGERIWLVTTNDNLEALRFYQRRGFRLSALRPGAVDESRSSLKSQIPTAGDFGIPVRDEIELEWRPPQSSADPG